MKNKIIAMAMIGMLLILVIPPSSGKILENSNCIVIGKTTNTWFDRSNEFEPFWILYGSLFLLYTFLVINLPHNILLIIAQSVPFISERIIQAHPLRRNVNVGFGTMEYIGSSSPVETPSFGSICTIGNNGTVTYEGQFWGAMGTMKSYYPRTLSRVGVQGFRGIKMSILHPIYQLPTYHIGFADHIRINTLE